MVTTHLISRRKVGQTNRKIDSNHETFTLKVSGSQHRLVTGKGNVIFNRMVALEAYE